MKKYTKAYDGFSGFRETADVSSESDDEIEVGGGKGKHDLLVKLETKPGFFKQSKKQYPMFPFLEEKVKTDEYGEIIRLAPYTLSYKFKEWRTNILFI